MRHSDISLRRTGETSFWVCTQPTGTSCSIMLGCYSFTKDDNSKWMVFKMVLTQADGWVGTATITTATVEDRYKFSLYAANQSPCLELQFKVARVKYYLFMGLQMCLSPSPRWLRFHRCLSTCWLVCQQDYKLPLKLDGGGGFHPRMHPINPLGVGSDKETDPGFISHFP